MGCAELCDGRRYANVTNGRLHGIAYFRHLHDIYMVLHGEGMPTA